MKALIVIVAGLMLAGTIEARDTPSPDPAPVMYRGHSPAYWHYKAKVADEQRAEAAQRLKQARVVFRKGLGPYKTRPPHYYEWMCIHQGEGAWNDPNAPYYGGLQMDMSFQRSYGWHLLQTKGTADNWTPLEQMWVAERAWASGRGFYPWPNTARRCGLI